MTDAPQTNAATEADRPAKPAPYAGPCYPRLFAIVETIMEKVGVSFEEFCARRDEVYRSHAPDRPPTNRFLAAVHDFVVADIQLEYWQSLQFNNLEHDADGAYGRVERAAIQAQKRYDKAYAALERDELARDKARAKVQEAREKRAFVLLRDQQRSAEASAVRAEKQKERIERDHQQRLDRQRRDAARIAAHAASPNGPPNSSSAMPVADPGDPDCRDYRQPAGADSTSHETPASPSPDLPQRTANLAEHHELAAEAAEADLPNFTSSLPSTPDCIAPLGSPNSDAAIPFAANSRAANGRSAPSPGRRRNRPHRSQFGRKTSLRD
jgi:hypothetical protein